MEQHVKNTVIESTHIIHGLRVCAVLSLASVYLRR